MKLDTKKAQRLAKVLTPYGTGIASELDSIEEKVDKVKETTDQLEANLTVVSEAQNLLINEVKQQSNDIDQLSTNVVYKADLEQLKPSLKGERGLPGTNGTNGRDGKDGVSVDEVAVIKNVKQNLPEFGNVFRDGLELLEGDNRLDISAIKGWEEKLNEVKSQIPTKTLRKIQYIRRYRLTDQCNGVTKSFTLPQDTVDVISVHGTQFPITYDPYVDWTLSGRTLTLTDEVGAPETGQTLFAIIETLFYA